jgi:hypothetical protein
MRAEGLRLVNPRDLEPLEAFDRVGRMILHAPEDDHAIAGRGDLVGIELEARTDAERRNLALDQSLGRLRERPLRLANADRERAAFGLAHLDQKLAKEVRFAGAPAAKCPLVARGLQQRLEHFCGWNSQDRQGCSR